MFWFLAFLLTALPSYTLPPRPSERPLLVEDHPELTFRTAAMLAQAYAGDRRGLAELRMSGSSEFNSVSLGDILAKLPTRRVVVVDLRQESHVLINDRLVTWEAGDDWANVGLSHDEAVDLERNLIRPLTFQRTVGLVDSKQYDHGEGSAGEAALVWSVRSEEQLVHSQGLRYERLTVTDHLRPADEEVDRFLRLVDSLDSEDWLHFHCRAGVGRTSVFMGMYDMLQNADAVPLQEILARAGSRDLNEIKGGPRQPYYAERHQFLSWFYRYSQARLAGSRLSWSEWLSQQS
ncbi:MAG: tyrosine protein phosphatase [Vulcanimicrobiota bacterium]